MSKLQFVRPIQVRDLSQRPLRREFLSDCMKQIIGNKNAEKIKTQFHLSLNIFRKLFFRAKIELDKRNKQPTLGAEGIRKIPIQKNFL